MAKEKPRKTAAEKAQDDLDAAIRKVSRLKIRKENADRMADAIAEDLQAAEIHRNYVAKHPALTQPTIVGEVSPEPEASEHEVVGADGLRQDPPATGGAPF